MMNKSYKINKRNCPKDRVSNILDKTAENFYKRNMRNKSLKRRSAILNKIRRLELQGSSRDSLSNLLNEKLPKINELENENIDLNYEILGLMDNIRDLEELLSNIIGSNSDKNSIMNSIEKFLLMTYSISQCKSWSGCLSIIMMDLKTYHNKSWLSKDNYNYIKDLLFNIFKEEKEYESQYNMKLQNGIKYFSLISQIIKNFHSFKETELFKKIHKLCMYLISINLFSNLGIDLSYFDIDNMYEKHIKKTHNIKSVSFISWILETVEWIIKESYNIFFGDGFDIGLFDDNAEREWFDNYEKIELWYKHLTNLESIGGSYFELVSLVNTTFEKAQILQSFLSRTCHTKPKLLEKFNKCFFHLKDIKNSILSKDNAMKTRRAPFMFLSIGTSSIMKSTLSKILSNYLVVGNKDKYRPHGDKYIYYMNPYDEYVSGYASYMHTLVIDEIMCLKSDKLVDVDTSIKRINQIANNCPYVTEQAALEDKGKTPMRAEIVLSTTNNDMHSDLFSYYNNSYSVMRRFNVVIDLIVKPEYCKLNSMGQPINEVDKSKVPQGSYPDIWIFIVKKVVPYMGNKKTHQNFLLEVDTSVGKKGIFDNLMDFLEYCLESLKLHDYYQDKAMDYDNMFESMKLCSGCNRIPEFCNCMKLQGFVQNLKNFGLVVNGIKETAKNQWNTGDKIWSMLSQLLSTDHGRRTGADFVKLMANKENLCSYRLNYDNISSSLSSDSVYSSIYSVDSEDFYDCRSFKTKFLDGCDDVFNFVRDWISNHSSFCKIALGITSLISLLLIGCKFLKRCNDSPSENKENDILQGITGSAPIPLPIERDNVWYQEEYSLSSCELSDAICCNKGKDLSEIISNNLIYFEVRDYETNQMHFCRGLGIGGHIYMFNNHTVYRKESFTVKIVHHNNSNGGVSPNIECVIDQSQIFRLPENDICFIEIKNLPAKRNIIKYFCKNTVNATFQGSILKRNSDGSVDRRKFFNARRVPALYTKGNNPLFPDFDYRPDQLFDSYLGFVMKPTIEGDCGSVYIAESNLGSFILGIHQAGLGANVNCAFTYDEMIKCAISYFNRPIFSPGKITINAKDTNHKLGELNPKSEVRFLQDGHADVYGSFENMSFNGKSKVVKSAISHIVTKYGYEVRDAKPAMRGWRPYHLALAQMVKTSQKFKQNTINLCVQSYITDILGGVNKQMMSETYPCDIKTAINGIDGIQYIDAIKWNTSMGFPWCKSKKNYKIGNLNDYKFPNDIMERIENIKSTYLNGERCNPIFNACLKDEVVSQEKADLEKTRLFSGAPVDWSVAYRQFFLPLIRLIQNNKFPFEAAVGTIAQSREWHYIYEHVTKFGTNRMVAGDFGKFDKKMPSQFILAAFDVLIHIARHCGYDNDSIKIMYGMAEDIAFSMVNVHGTLYQFFGTNPSGHPLTVIINSIVNSLYMRYMYYDLNPNHECFTFQENVALMTYGDDNMFGVKQGCDWFNHTAIQNNFAKYDIQYTMADKDSDSVPFIDIKDISFLKRKFRWDDDLCVFTAPLDENSINRALTMCVASNVVPLEAQAIGTITNVVREYFWYGRDIYNKKRQLFINVFNEACIEKPSFKFYAHENMFPYWDTLVNDFNVISNKVDKFNNYYKNN